MRIFFGLADWGAKNIISPCKFLESLSLRHLKCSYWAIELLTAPMSTFLGGNKEKLCFNFTKCWPVETNCEHFQSHTKDSVTFKNIAEQDM